MAADTVVLFPGQGAYMPGLFAGRSEPELAEVLRVVDRVAGEFGRSGVSGFLTRVDGPSAAELVSSDSFALQLAVFAATVGGYRLAARNGAVDVLVGHSMGEIAALTVAGAFDLADGARLVCHRSEALSAGGSRPGGMIALELQAARAAHLVGVVGDAELAVAVLNAPQQTVVAGPMPALETVTRVAEALGIRATRLNAPFPFHSPMLGVAAERFAEAIGGIRQRALRATVYSPVAGGFVNDGQDLKALLVRHLTTPVPFLVAIRELHAAGIRNFIECSPAGLSALVRRTVPDVTTSTATESTSGKAPRVQVPTAQLAAPAPAKPSVTITPRNAVAPAVQISAVAAAKVPVVGVAPRNVPGPTAQLSSAVKAAVSSVPKNSVAALAAQPPSANTPSAASVLEQLRELYASTLGYPPEAITADADLEADLGIDSLKRAEMLVKVNAHFGLPPSADTSQFATHQTLADLAEMVAAVQVTTPR
jgi:acyl transferase domain-containing protein